MPELLYMADNIQALVAWAAQAAFELDWPIFCQHVLAHPTWCELLEMQDQAGVDRLAERFSEVAIHLIELAAHDGLKAGDQCDHRPEGPQSKVRDEFDEFIGTSKLMKLLKKRLRPFLKKLGTQDPQVPANRPRTNRTRSFLLADLRRWRLRLKSTHELIRKLKQLSNLAGAADGAC